MQEGTPLAFVEGRSLNRLPVGMAPAEIVADKLPMTPSRKAAAAFAGRVLSGELAGAAVGCCCTSRDVGVPLGMAGAVVGTEGGAAFRSWLASVFDRDQQAAVHRGPRSIRADRLRLQQAQECALPAESSLT